jgi:hypothetical protein
MAVKPSIPQFPYVSTRTLRLKHLELGKHRESELRRQLPSPLYYVFSGRKILWNVELVKDWVLNGDLPDHQKLIESYLCTLPSQRLGA